MTRNVSNAKNKAYNGENYFIIRNTGNDTDLRTGLILVCHVMHQKREYLNTLTKFKNIKLIS